MCALSANCSPILASTCTLWFPRPRLLRCKGAFKPLPAAPCAFAAINELTFHFPPCTRNTCFIDPLKLMIAKLSTSWGPPVLSHVELGRMQVGGPRIFGSGGAGCAKYPRSASFRAATQQWSMAAGAWSLIINTW